MYRAQQKRIEQLKIQNRNREKQKYLLPTKSEKLKPFLAAERNIGAHYLIQHTFYQGQHSQLRYAVNRHTNENVAVKVFERQKLGPEQLRDIIGEAEILLDFSDNSHILQFKDLFVTEKYIFLVTELLHMDLYRYTKMVGGQLSEKSVKEIFKWCVQTVQSCHRRNVIHRDLKPENILVNVDKAGNITALRLADFGQSCDSGKPVSRSGKFGTRGYTAPEALVGYRKLDFKIDCWSLGVILYNLVCGGVMPFEGTAQQVKFQTLNRKPEFDDLGWQRLSPSALDLAQGLLCKDSSRRLSIDQVLEHGWFSEISASR